MIRVRQVKVPIKHSEADIKASVFRRLHVSYAEIYEFNIVKRSLDARDKSDIHYVYTVDIISPDEKNILNRNRNNPHILIPNPAEYKLPAPGALPLNFRPIVVGSGPAGIFCAYFLAKYGYKPVVIERGSDIDSRIKTVSEFWAGKSEINPDTNVQFGEGGAGTFSDGKLNTGVNDPCGRNMLVLKTFVQNGANEEILYDNKPHLGTDALAGIVKKMRCFIIERGGSFLFNTRLTDITVLDGKLKSIEILSEDNSKSSIDTDTLILAIGHSARDTFKMLLNRGIYMEPKPFAVGVRIEHMQNTINISQYGKGYDHRYGNLLPAADYKLTCRTKDGRSVYSFCMCPGGYVVNSSSESGGICVNGMSYASREGKGSNSAIVVGITPEDIGAAPDNPLRGVIFQQELEAKAFKEGRGAIPVQRFGDFEKVKPTEKYGKVCPKIKGRANFGDINKILPPYICDDIKEAVHIFGKKIESFDDADALLFAVESRTSSPVRIVRNARFESNISGLYPCGEGAGYAGGIVSAAIDGIKVFEEIYGRYSVS